MLNRKKKYLSIVFFVLLFVTACYSQTGDHKNHDHRSHYTSEVNNAIKALTEEEINQLISGDGMGLAKAAELNSYPGPRHVLELSEELSLTDEQIFKTEILFDSMKSEAVKLGKLIIGKEKELDVIFRNNIASQKIIQDKVLEISELKGRLRFVHLNTHLMQKIILTNEQVSIYNKLRGYN